MFRLIFLFGISFFSLLPFMKAKAQKVIPIKQTPEYVGDTVKVCDSVFECKIIRSIAGEDTIALDIGTGKSKFTVFLPRSLSFDFSSAEQTLRGKKICVQGKSVSFNGKNGIIVSNKDNIKISQPGVLRWLFYQRVFTPDKKEVHFPTNISEFEVHTFFDSTGFVSAFPVDVPDDPRQPSIYRDDFYGRVFFRLFTDTPLYVFTNHPERIKKYISMHSLEKYYHSLGFLWDLNKRIEKKDLTINYVLKTIGQPNKREQKIITEKVTEILYYNRYNIRLIFIDGIFGSFKLDI
jgi:hypothetical protein